MRDNIFAELYNKLLGFFNQAEENETAKDVACNRLRVVLMQDRTNLTPQLLEKMRGELVELLSKYLEMDKEALELNLEQEGEQMALMLSIPVIRAKDEDEIEETKTKESDKEADEEADEEASEEDTETDDPTINEVLEEKTVEEPTTQIEKSSKTEEKNTEEFPNKEICGDCRECELSEDIECEKKEPKKVKKSK